MSVLVSDRTESKFEAITYSIELHDMLIDFMQQTLSIQLRYTSMNKEEIIRIQP